MGGAAVVSSGKGAANPLDAAINLVPFIDLLSCCISFLLITAVWVNRSHRSETPASRNDGTDQEIDTDAKVTLTLSSSGVVISRSTGGEERSFRGSRVRSTKLGSVVSFAAALCASQTAQHDAACL